MSGHNSRLSLGFPQFKDCRCYYAPGVITTRIWQAYGIWRK